MIRLTRNLNNFENILTAAAEGLFVVSTFYYLLNNLAVLKVLSYVSCIYFEQFGSLKRFKVMSGCIFFEQLSRKTDAESSSEMPGMQLMLSRSSFPSSPSDSGLQGFQKITTAPCVYPH